MLAQHIFGVACSGPFADALFSEIITRAVQLARAEFDDILSFVTNGGYAFKHPQCKRLALEDGSIMLCDSKWRDNTA